MREIFFTFVSAVFKCQRSYDLSVDYIESKHQTYFKKEKTAPFLILPRSPIMYVELMVEPSFG